MTEASRFEDRLKRLHGKERGQHAEAGPSGVEPAAGRSDALRAWLSLRETTRRRKREPVPLPEGEELQNPRGTCYLRRLRLPLSQHHGAAALATALQIAPTRIATLAKDRGLEDLDPRDCLFLDTETTGLAGGAGTVVFLCGIATLAGQDLLLEQVFMRSFAEEAAALWFVADRLEGHRTLVTYVGKSFDRHRLAARMAVQRVANQVLTPRHLDLYHLTRRAHRLELPDFRLKTVERDLLGFERLEDLPGAEAPAAFLDWLRDGSGNVDRVFEHNRLDVMSLVALLGHLGSA